ncbi:MAG: conserved repeat domain [Ramlibacter sp.]|nr:conserved repeat domain [Ramlibacter sp.]
MKSVLKTLLGRGGTLAVLCVSALLAVGNAHAVGTLAGTTIGNKATLSYSVGAVVQTPIASAPTGSTNGTGATTTFVVDNKVNLTVTASDASPVNGVAGQSLVTATFVVSNTGNNTQDFALTTANLASGAGVTLGVTPYTDNFDMTGCTISVAGVTQTYISSLAPDGSQTVKVVCAIPLSQPNGDISGVSLVATARAAGTNGVTVLVQSPTNDPNVVDIVFADGAGTDDIAFAANHSSRSAYRVATAALTVTKTFTSVCDPFNGGTNPKNIPGSYVQYSLSITNNGGASATLTQITDVLNGSLTFDPDLISGAGVAANCAAGIAPLGGAGKGFRVTYAGRPAASYPKYLTSSSGDSDGGSFAAGTITIDFSTALPAEATFGQGELKVGDTVQVVFQVKIN